MFDIIEITIDDFKKSIYDKYVKLFPEDEQRDLNKIENTYSKKIEHFYKILLDNIEIGFIMIEKINNYLPYYLDYFAIYKEYQNKGYGSKAIRYLLDNIILNDGLIGEIEKVEDSKLQTKKRLEFYEKLGFEKVDSEYLLYNVSFNPIVYLRNKEISKEKIDKIFFDYYRINCGEDEVNKNCKIIR